MMHTPPSRATGRSHAPLLAVYCKDTETPDAPHPLSRRDGNQSPQTADHLQPHSMEGMSIPVGLADRTVAAHPPSVGTKATEDLSTLLLLACETWSSLQSQ